MKSLTTILEKFKRMSVQNVLDIVFVVVATVTLLGGRKMYIKDPEIVFFDVGQGDSILIQQHNFQILVDGGPDDSVIYSLGEYMPWYDRNIEVAILTHPHDDHIYGLLSVLSEYSVGKILYNPVEYSTFEYEYMLQEYGDIMFSVVEGDVVDCGDIEVEVLFPFEETYRKDSNINNESIVLLVQMYEEKVLLMGDAEFSEERRLLSSGVLEDVDILKVGHHCSRTSTSDMFLSLVNPEVAICSCGEGNKFGHPHYETLEKLQSRGVQYFVTSRDGDVRFVFKSYSE